MKITFELTPADYAQASDILADLVQRVRGSAPVTETVPKETVPAQAPEAAPAPTAPAPAEVPAPAVMPTSKPVFTQEQLALAATQLMDAGKQAELIAVLNDMGVPSLANLDESRYSDFAARIRSLGAKI